MSSFLKQLKQAASKVGEMVGMEQAYQPGMDGDPLDESRARVAGLRQAFGEMKATISSYARHLHTLTLAGAEVSTEWAGLYSHSQARSNSLQCFTSTSTRLEQFGHHLSTDAIPWEVMKVFDDWDAEAARMKADIEKTVQAKQKVADLEEKVKSLRASKERRLRKNEPLSDKEETQLEASEQMLDKYQGLHANMRVNLEINLSQFYDQRFTVMDKAFVRFMELQMEFYREGVQAVSGYQTIVDNYRKRYPLEKGPKYPIPEVASPVASSGTTSAAATPVPANGAEDLMSFPAAVAAANGPTRPHHPHHQHHHHHHEKRPVDPSFIAQKQQKGHEDENESATPAPVRPQPPRRPAPSQSQQQPSSPHTQHIRQPSRQQPNNQEDDEEEEEDSTDSDTDTASDSDSSDSDSEHPAHTKKPHADRSDSAAAAAAAATRPPLSAQSSMDILGFASDSPPSRTNSGNTPTTTTTASSTAKPSMSRQGSSNHRAEVVPDLFHTTTAAAAPVRTSSTTAAAAAASAKSTPMSNSDFSFDWSGGAAAAAPAAATAATPPSRQHHLPVSQSSPALTDRAMQSFDPLDMSSSSSVAAAQPQTTPSKPLSLAQRSASTANSSAASSSVHLARSASPTITRSGSTPYLPPTRDLDQHVHQESERKVAQLREAEAQAESALEARRDAEVTVEGKLNAWELNKDGNKKNIRSLLSSVHTVLWPNSGWKALGIADLIDFAAIKKAHMKIIRIVHPDKLTDATPEQLAIALRVFDSLNTAFDQFKTENGM